MNVFKIIYKGDITLEGIEKEQIEFRKDLGRINQGEPKDKSLEQKETINNIFITQEKKLFKSLMIMLRACLEIFMIQNKEQDLKY